MFRHTVILFFVFCYQSHFGQKSFQPKQVEFDWKGIVYRNEYTGNLTAHTNGFSIAYNKGRIKTYYKTDYYHFELGILRDPREQSQNRTLSSGIGKLTKSYKFGKQNSVFQLKAGKGTKRLVTDKAKRNGLAIGYNYEAGPTLAILRPYYLELIYREESDGRSVPVLKTERYTDQNKDKFLDYNSIFGRAGGSSGWSEVSIVPGIQGKFGAFFSLGAFEKYAKSVEIGIMGDLYLKKIPIMVETENVSAKPYFVNFYLTLEFGKRTN